MTYYSQSQLYSLAMSVGLPSSAAQIAASIAMAESGGNTNAINPGNGVTDIEYSVGLWQINLLAHPQYTVAQMEDPTSNAKAMSVISNGGTAWGAWGTYNSGAYRKYMNNIVTGSSLPTSYDVPISTLGTYNNTISLPSSVKTNPATTSDLGSAWTYILAYTVVALILVFISRFQVGYNALYYMAVLFLMLLLVTQSQFIVQAISPITGVSGNTPATTQV